MRSRLKTMKRCCHGTAHQKCHGKHEALLAVGVVYGSDTFFRDITVYLRDGSFSSVRELESSITTFLALRNAQRTRYVWNAKGEEILNKIQRAREAMASLA